MLICEIYSSYGTIICSFPTVKLLYMLKFQIMNILAHVNQ